MNLCLNAFVRAQGTSFMLWGFCFPARESTTGRLACADPTEPVQTNEISAGRLSTMAETW